MKATLKIVFCLLAMVAFASNAQALSKEEEKQEYNRRLGNVVSFNVNLWRVDKEGVRISRGKENNHHISCLVAQNGDCKMTPFYMQIGKWKASAEGYGTDINCPLEIQGYGEVQVKARKTSKLNIVFELPKTLCKSIRINNTAGDFVKDQHYNVVSREQNGSESGQFVIFDGTGFQLTYHRFYSDIPSLESSIKTVFSITDDQHNVITVPVEFGASTNDLVVEVDYSKTVGKVQIEFSTKDYSNQASTPDFSKAELITWGTNNDIHQNAPSLISDEFKYLLLDGKRHAIPYLYAQANNEYRNAVIASWNINESEARLMPISEMENLRLGENVTIRPNTGILLKVSDASTADRCKQEYIVVEHKKIREVTGAERQELCRNGCGIVTVPDAFWGNYMYATSTPDKCPVE